LLALDARVLVYDRDTAEDQLPKLAIRAYPIQYVGTWIAGDKTNVTIRPILPEDEELLVKFHGILSDRSVYLRYLQPMMYQERVVHERLSRICHGDYNREITLVAEKEGEDDERSIMGVVRLSKVHGTNEARMSLLVADPYQSMGLGAELVRRAIDVARREHLERISTMFTDDNQVMQHICKKAGFVIEPSDNEKQLTASLKL
jgi:acetyltransferase